MLSCWRTLLSKKTHERASRITTTSMKNRTIADLLSGIKVTLASIVPLHLK